MKQAQKTVALWFFLVIVAVFVFQMYENRQQTLIQDFNYSKFAQAVEAKEIASVVIHQDTGEIAGDIKPEFEKKYGGKNFQIVGNVGDEGYKFLVGNGITPNYAKSESNGVLMSLLMNWLPFLLGIGFLFFIMRQIQVGGGKAMSFGKSKAKLLTEHKNKIT